MKDFILNNWWQMLLLTPFIIGASIVMLTILHIIYVNSKHAFWFALVLITVTIGLTNISKAETYQYKNGLTIEAPDYKTAAKLCYKKLNPVFVSDEKALDAIDVCTNPIKGEVK